MADSGAKMQPGKLYWSPNEIRANVPNFLTVPNESLASLSLDYGWLDKDGNVILVERKGIMSELPTDLHNGHLRDQLEKAKKETNHLWLVVEDWNELTGYADDDILHNIHGGWTYGNFLRALFSLLYGLQVSGPVPSRSRRDTATLLSVLYSQSKRDSLGSGRPALPKWQATKRASVAESYARAFPGLGFQRAEALAASFPCWEALVKAKQKDLEKISGFGPILAGRIYDGLRKKD